jgi:hypothetical protein
MPKVNYHMANGKVVLGDPPEGVLDYHNNDLVADLHHFLSDHPIGMTDWDYLCAIARIVDKRKFPIATMRDCQTGKSYASRGVEAFEEAFRLAKLNAGI